jgi:hypothetical protein
MMVQFFDNNHKSMTNKFYLSETTVSQKYAKSE